MFSLPQISSTLTFQLFWTPLLQPQLAPAAEGHHLLAGMSPHTGVKYAATRLSVGLHTHFSIQCGAISVKHRAKRILRRSSFCFGGQVGHSEILTPSFWAAFKSSIVAIAGMINLTTRIAQSAWSIAHRVKIFIVKRNAKKHVPAYRQAGVIRVRLK